MRTVIPGRPPTCRLARIVRSCSFTACVLALAACAGDEAGGPGHVLAGQVPGDGRVGEVRRNGESAHGAVRAGAGRSVELSWRAPTTDTAGSPLTDLAGFRVYLGTTPGVYSRVFEVRDPDARTFALEGLAAGRTYHVSVTAYDRAGEESHYSNEGSFSLP